MKKTKVKILMILIISLITLLGAGHGVNAVEPLKAEEDNINVVLNGKRYIFTTGGTGKTTYASNDETVATVSEYGQVTGNKIGSTTVTATKGEETVNVKVNVVYGNISIKSNIGTAGTINLLTNTHKTEACTAIVKDYNGNEIKEAKVTWTSGDSSIVTVDDKGVVTAVKAGKTTITASATGVTTSREVEVTSEESFTDFSNAKYETSLELYTAENLKISGVKPKEKSDYYYFITSENKKPEISYTKYGGIDLEKTQNEGRLLANTEENYLYSRQLAQYAELNQDMYLWVIEQKKLENNYYNEDGSYAYYKTQFDVEGKKLERAELPKLNLIMKQFLLSSFNQNEGEDGYSSLWFYFPTATENRKFTLKVGKVTDTAILSKIQKEDYSGITDLLKYAKTHDAVYSEKLTTTSAGRYWSKTEALFDGRKLLENRAYYYIYVEFDDENGKYYPIEGVTLGQAWLSSSSDSWDIWAYTSSDFKWDNLTVTSEETPAKVEEKKEDKTVTPAKKLPQTGVNLLIPIIAIMVSGIVFISYKKFRNIKLK